MRKAPNDASLGKTSGRLPPSSVSDVTPILPPPQLNKRNAYSNPLLFVGLSQVSFLPRNQWVSRNTVSPACCVVAVGRPLTQKNQSGSFNERRELSSLSWKGRVEKGCHAACIQTHCAEAAGADCMLEGPLSGCHVSSWYITVGPALPGITNSPFCEGGLLNHLNEALMDADLNWTRVSPCGSCRAASAASILSRVAALCNFSGDCVGHQRKRECLVFGDRSAWSPSEGNLGNLALRFSAAPSFPRRGNMALHDGDPGYQHQVVGCLVFSLQTLGSGDALLLPVFSALTRVTAAVVLCLHVCFRSVAFRCPPPSGVVGALLVCVGFCPEAAAGVLPVLTDLLDCMGRLEGEKDSREMPSPPRQDRQVLQFVPMEEMLNRGLTEFLRTLNTEIIQKKLHLLMLA